MTVAYRRKHLIITVTKLTTDYKGHRKEWGHLGNVSQWFLILHQHLGELQSLLGTDPHHISKQKDPVWSVADLQRKKDWVKHI